MRLKVPTKIALEHMELIHPRVRWVLHKEESDSLLTFGAGWLE